MTDSLSPEELEALLAWPTPAISNAIELFEIRPRNQGFMLPEIQCRFPDLKPMIGYAVTGIISADSSEGHHLPPSDWWAEIQKYQGPRVAVLHVSERLRMDPYAISMRCRSWDLAFFPVASPFRMPMCI